MKLNDSSKDKALLAVSALLLLFLMLCAGCCRCKDITTKSDTLYVTKTDIHNNYIHDSIFTDRYHNIYIQGDTVYNNQITTIYRQKTIHDTVRSTDTVYSSQSTQTQQTKKEKPKPRWWCIVFLVAVPIPTLLIVSRITHKIHGKHNSL